MPGIRQRFSRRSGATPSENTTAPDTETQPEARAETIDGSLRPAGAAQQTTLWAAATAQPPQTSPPTPATQAGMPQLAATPGAALNPASAAAQGTQASAPPQTADATRVTAASGASSTAVPQAQGTPDAIPTSPLEPKPPGFVSRGRMRRRLHYLRRVREIGYRDLGGLVFDQHRFARPNESLVMTKVSALAQIDGEVRALEHALNDKRATSELREAGIAACPRCGAIHGSEARYCPSCGLTISGPTELGAIQSSLAPRQRTVVAGGFAAPQQSRNIPTPSAPPHASAGAARPAAQQPEAGIPAHQAVTPMPTAPVPAPPVSAPPPVPPPPAASAPPAPVASVPAPPPAPASSATTPAAPFARTARTPMYPTVSDAEATPTPSRPLQPSEQPTTVFTSPRPAPAASEPSGNPSEPGDATRMMRPSPDKPAQSTDPSTTAVDPAATAWQTPATNVPVSGTPLSSRDQRIGDAEDVSENKSQ